MTTTTKKYDWSAVDVALDDLVLARAGLKVSRERLRIAQTELDNALVANRTAEGEEQVAQRNLNYRTALVIERAGE